MHRPFMSALRWSIGVSPVRMPHLSGSLADRATPRLGRFAEKLGVPHTAGAATSPLMCATAIDQNTDGPPGERLMVTVECALALTMVQLCWFAFLS